MIRFEFTTENDEWLLHECSDAAQQYDENSVQLLVTGGFPAGFTQWNVLLSWMGNLNVIPLSEDSGGYGAILSAEELSFSGDAELQLQGIANGVRRHTNILVYHNRRSLSGDAQWPELPHVFSDAVEEAVEAKNGAQTARTAAETARAGAAVFASNAETAKTAAQTAAAAAMGSASVASGSASAAAASEEAAAGSEERAEEKADAAQASAALAQTAAGSAALSAERAQTLYGSPLAAFRYADMTDTGRVYVYTGEEPAMEYGNWYYHDGDDWVSGGVYNAGSVDGVVLVDQTVGQNYLLKLRLIGGKPVIVYDQI